MTPVLLIHIVAIPFWKILIGDQGCLSGRDTALFPRNCSNSGFPGMAGMALAIQIEPTVFSDGMDFYPDEVTHVL
jgi:hypothetical protein